MDQEEKVFVSSDQSAPELLLKNIRSTSFSTMNNSKGKLQQSVVLCLLIQEVVVSGQSKGEQWHY